MMKRAALYAILGAVIVLAVVGGLVWRSQSTSQLEEQDVRSAVVERGTMLVAVSASGSIEPRDRVRLAFEVPGQAAEVLVDVADQVDAGDVLMRLDTRQLELQVQQAQAALALAEAQLAQLEAGPRPAEVAAAEANLQAAQAQLSAAVANRDQLEDNVSAAQVASAEAQVASAKLELEIAQDRYDAIAEEGTQKEQANYQLYAAKQAFSAAQTELGKLLEGADKDDVRAARADVGAASAQRDAVQAQLDLLVAGTPDEQIADAEAQVAQAQAALDLAELSLRQAVLRAPFDGIVSGVNISVGERASIGSPVVELIDSSGFRLVVGVDEIDVGRLSETESVQVTLDAFPDALITGTVESIASIATLEGGVVYYDVAIELAPTDVPIRADMTANATIVVEELADVLKIPTWVVRVDRDAGRTYVHRQVGDEIEQVDVTLGVRYEGVAQVLDGLSEGDEVVWVTESTPFDFREE